MDFGIAVATSADSWKVAKRAEELGFSHIWFYDTQLLSADCFVAMGAAALATQRIRLGTGVLIPSNRIAPVAANGLASLNQLAPGRVDFGVGTGFTGRRTMGLGAIRLSEMAEYIDQVEALLSDETVEWEFEGRRRKIRFLNPEAGSINTRDPIATHISAFGPKGRELVATRGAGWITFMFDSRAAIGDLRSMQQAWSDCGRDDAELYSTAFTLGCVLEDGEAHDSPRAKAQAGPLAAVSLHNLVESDLRSVIDPAQLPAAVGDQLEGYRELYRGYEPEDARYLSLHRGHLMFLRPDEQKFISAELIRDFTFTGTADRLRDELRAMKDAGYSQFAVQLVDGELDAIEDWAVLLKSV